MTRGGQVDPGPLHQRGDHVIIELLDGDHDEHRPNGLSHVSIEQSNESSEGPADHRAEKRDQIEKPAMMPIRSQNGRSMSHMPTLEAKPTMIATRS